MNLSTHTQILQHLEEVKDPEVPVLSIIDLGIVRDVQTEGDDKLSITITPTYTGCPAMQVIEDDIRSKLEEKGWTQIIIKTVLSPAWTTDWLSEEGKRKLLEYGIAPPQGAADKNSLLGASRKIPCPQCGSEHTDMISQFGSTACKALYRCKDCLEPFDYFKCI